MTDETIEPSTAGGRSREDEWRQRYFEARDALFQFNNPPDPRLLREIADEVDCGNDCEHGHTEWDTNAHVCSRADRKEGCAGEKASCLRQFADAIDVRSRLPLASSVEATGGAEWVAVRRATLEEWARMTDDGTPPTADDIHALIVEPSAPDVEPPGGVTSPDYVHTTEIELLRIAGHLGRVDKAHVESAARELTRLRAAAPPSPRSDEIKKRPAAFRVWSNGHWAYFDDEDVARDFAGDGDYQGLYVRDGGQP